MISFGNAALFAFNKRSFIIGSILLFLTFLLMVIVGYTIYKMGPEFVLGLENLSKETWSKIGYILYAIKTFFYSILFAYFFILAKKEVYNQPDRFSSEFFYKVLATIFAFGLVLSLIMYVCSGYTTNWIVQQIIMILSDPTPFKIIKTITTALIVMMLFIYCVVSFYMAYLMQFNFSNFFFKLRYSFASPLTFLKIIGWYVLFVLLSIIPIILLYPVLGSFDSGAVMMSFASCFMGTQSSVALFFYAVLMGIPIGIFCVNTVGGRIFGLCVTLWYFVLYGILRLVGMPAFPISALLYVYIFFFIISLLYAIFTIVFPCFWIHLLAQGALEVNRKFDPTVGLSEGEKLLSENLDRENSNVDDTFNDIESE